MKDFRGIEIVPGDTVVYVLHLSIGVRLVEAQVALVSNKEIVVRFGQGLRILDRDDQVVVLQA